MNQNTGFRRVIRTLSKLRRVKELLEDNDSTSASASGLAQRDKNRKEALKLLGEVIG